MHLNNKLKTKSNFVWSPLYDCKRKKMAKQNGYDKGLRNWKDFDFHRRLICHGPSKTTTKSTWKARSWRLKADWFVWDLIKNKLCSRRNEATGNVCHREIIRFQSKEIGKEGLSSILNGKLECELAPHYTRGWRSCFLRRTPHLCTVSPHLFLSANRLWRDFKSKASLP